MCEVVSKTLLFFKKNPLFSKKPIVFQHVHFFYLIVLKRKIITVVIKETCMLQSNKLLFLGKLSVFPIETPIWLFFWKKGKFHLNCFSQITVKSLKLHYIILLTKKSYVLCIYMCHLMRRHCFAGLTSMVLFP